MRRLLAPAAAILAMSIISGPAIGKAHQQPSDTAMAPASGPNPAVLLGFGLSWAEQLRAERRERPRPAVLDLLLPLGGERAPELLHDQAHFDEAEARAPVLIETELLRHDHATVPAGPLWWWL